MNTVPTKNILEENIEALFGFESMTDDEKVALLDDIGTTVFESAILRYVTENTKEDVEAFEKFVEVNAEKEDMMQQLIETFPTFGKMIEEEIAAFKEEALEVLSP